ncbi:MAG: hypothetical protein ACOCZ5_01730 [bacterium]
MRILLIHVKKGEFTYNGVVSKFKNIFRFYDNLVFDDKRITVIDELLNFGILFTSVYYFHAILDSITYLNRFYYEIIDTHTFRDKNDEGEPITCIILLSEDYFEIKNLKSLLTVDNSS